MPDDQPSQLRTKDVLAVIPARGASKGLPRKNIRLLGGKPLLAYSIEAARRAPSVTRVIVSTDDPEIAEVAEALGAEVPFLRPPWLAEDRVVTGKVTKHLLNTLEQREGYTPDLLLELYPTSPFRTMEMIETICSKVLEGYRMALTVAPIHFTPKYYFVQDEGGTLASLKPKSPTDTWKYPLYRHYGLCSATNQAPKVQKDTYFHIVDDPISLIDIDYEEDLAVAEEILAQGLYRRTFTCMS